MDDLTKGLIEHLKKSDPGLRVVETPQFVSINDFHPMPNDRDTHFLGFAKLQMPELDNLFTGLHKASIAGNIPLRDAYIQRIETYLAQRAYDLIVHMLNSVDQYQPVEDVRMDAIPDLTQWPASPTPLPDARVEPAPSDDQLL